METRGFTVALKTVIGEGIVSAFFDNLHEMLDCKIGERDCQSEQMSEGFFFLRLVISVLGNLPGSLVMIKCHWNRGVPVLFAKYVI